MHWQEWSIEFEVHCAVPEKFRRLINNATERLVGAFPLKEVESAHAPPEPQHERDECAFRAGA
jgi:hypothetical protein